MNDLLVFRTKNYGLTTGTQNEIDIRELLFVFFYMDTGNSTGFKNTTKIILEQLV